MADFEAVILFGNKTKEDREDNGKSKKKKAGKGAFAGGFIGSILGSLLSSVKQLFSPLEAIATLLVAALFPILKPFLILFLKVGILLFRFLNNILGTDSPVKGISGIDPETGETIVGEAGKKIALQLALIAGVIGAIVATIAGAPIALALAIGLGIVLIGKKLIEFGIFLGDKIAEFAAFLGTKNREFVELIREKIIDFATLLGEKFSEGVKFFVKTLTEEWKAFLELLNTSLTSLSDFGTWLWDALKNIFTTSLEGLKGIGSAIKKWIFSFLPGIGRGSSTKVNDAIITPNGDLIRTNPNDFLIATKNPGELMGGNGGSKEITVNVNGGLITEEVARDIGKIVMREVQLGGRF